MRNSLHRCLALAALLTAAPASAAAGLALGALEVRSALGEPFAATLAVDAGDAAALARLKVRLASPADYAKHELPRPATLDGLRFTLASEDGATARIAIDGAAPMREPTLSLLVEASTGSATVQREYTVLLDPPGRGASRATAAPAAKLAADAPAAKAADEHRGAEWDYELDAYYSDVSVEIPLTDEPVPDGGKLSEWDVYRRLFLDSLHPRVLLFEASVYPMPVLGTYIKEHSPDTYDSFTLGSTDVNLLEAVTAGFQEPWAVSAFVGSEMNFTREGRSASKGTSKGYMGYLISYGAKHIKDNVLIDDDWWEFEWKLKGERERADDHLVWSFRTGVKNHANPFISDVIYVGARRSSLDFEGRFLSWLQNSSFDTMVEFTQDSLQFARLDFVIGKKYPFKSKGFALALDFGVIYEKQIEYLGTLASPNADTVTIVFRPNIEF